MTGVDDRKPLSWFSSKLSEGGAQKVILGSCKQHGFDTLASSLWSDSDYDITISIVTPVGFQR